ncbi:hypothetical protein GF339_08515 [candidate division KSB3 bacterium]|uniref:LPS-assembly lipoprotein LptE n=1 Tax=candidate division KSB3 bacterium TaxID=2044937 RepID=A0A9D5Q5R2_9BACT|nr:hypothetical protein [candidate division KSB3 bacterium]MBD3324613.1 hypothetical protein [candidate division KSB3 bacterium]
MSAEKLVTRAKSRKSFGVWGICLLGLILSGCGYTLVGQGSLPDHIETIAIPTFENETLEEGVEEIITRAVIDEYVSGGKMRLVAENEADAVLRGTIRSYSADEAVTYNELNEVSSYKLEVGIDAELEDRVNDEILWETEGLTEDADFDGGPDVDITTQQENETEALQEVAEELAETIRALSTEGF